MDNDKCKPVEPSSSDVGMWKDEKGQLEFALALVETMKELRDEAKTEWHKAWAIVKFYMFLAILAIILFFVCVC